MSAERYLIGKSTLDLSLGRLRRNGADVSVATQELRAAAISGHPCGPPRDQGRVAVQDLARRDRHGRFAHALRERGAGRTGGSGQKMIKTVSKRGYVFAGPVTKLDEDAVPAAGLNAGGRNTRLRLDGRAGCAAAACLPCSSRWPGRLVPHLWRPAALPRAPVADRSAFSPILSADPAQDYLGDIVTEELTTALSRLRGSTVISSSSALTLKGKAVDIKQLGSELGVSYALEGSVLRSDGSVRINARLVDTQSLKTLWSDSFDVRRAELLQTQDEIVTRLASALQVELFRQRPGARQACRRRTLTPRIWRCGARPPPIVTPARSRHQTTSSVNGRLASIPATCGR